MWFSVYIVLLMGLVTTYANQTTTCDPPCEHGGTCNLDNFCECSEEFKGTRCQYYISRCSSSKLPFNGRKTCSTSETRKSCQISCPNGMDFEYPPVEYYNCEFSKGSFEPSTVPKCLSPVTTTEKVEKEKTKEKEKSKKTSKQFYILKLHNGSNMDKTTSIARTCSIWDGKTVKTFEGILYNTSIYSGHMLVQDKKRKLDVELHACPNGSPTECNHYLQVSLQNKIYRLWNKGGEMTLTNNGKEFLIPINLSDISVTPFGQTLNISLVLIGVEIFWDGKQEVTIKASPELWNRTLGLCNLERNYRNDFVTKNGYTSTELKTFADSWATNGPNTWNTHPREETPINTNWAKELRTEANNSCTDLLGNQIFDHCFQGLNETVLKEVCIESYCTCPDTNRRSCVCKIVTALVKECQLTGVKIPQNWRNSSMCPMTCNKDRVYQPDLIDRCECSEKYSEGNFNCIPIKHCAYLNVKYKDGDISQRHRENCTCEKGEWKCNPISVRSGASNLHQSFFNNILIKYLTSFLYLLQI